MKMAFITCLKNSYSYFLSIFSSLFTIKLINKNIWEKWILVGARLFEHGGRRLTAAGSSAESTHLTVYIVLFVRNELLFPLRTRFTDEGDITFAHEWLVTCIKVYFYSEWCSRSSEALVLGAHVISCLLVCSKEYFGRNA
jgi:hypothetical protein